MKVCHLTSVHPPFDIRIFHKECVTLSDSGYEVILLAPSEKEEIRQNVKVVPVKLPKNRVGRIMLAPYKLFVKALQQKAKVYHLHDPELLPCAILLRIAGKKVVFDVHENVRVSIVSKHWLPKWLSFFITWGYWFFERFALLFVHKLVLAEQSYLKYYPKHKAVVVQNYPILNQDLKVHYVPSKPVRIVYSGVVHPLRGVWEMLGLIKQLNEQGVESELWLIGELRPQSLSTMVHNFIVDHQLSNRVKIFGKVDFVEVSGLLKQADVGISLLKPIPNYFESLPTKILEYMQHGLPVITNDFPLYQKYVEEPQTGICVDIDDLDIGKVVRFLTDESELIRQSQNGEKLINTRFNWTMEREKLIKLYVDLVND